MQVQERKRFWMNLSTGIHLPLDWAAQSLGILLFWSMFGRCRRYGPWILVYWRATILYLWKTIFCRNRWFFIKIKKMVTSSFLSKMHASSICMKVNDLNWLQLCWWRVSETFYVGGRFFTWKKLPTSQRDGRSMITPQFIFSL